MSRSPVLPLDWQPKTDATLVFVIRDEQVLLIRKLRGHGKGLVNAPGGKVDDGELPREGAIREVQEEIGVTVSDPDLRAVIRFHDTITDYRVRGFIYVSHQYSGEIIRTPEAEPDWWDIKNIPYNEMWEDDILWLPFILRGDRLLGDFVFEDDRLVAYSARLSDESLDELRFVNST